VHDGASLFMDGAFQAIADAHNAECGRQQDRDVPSTGGREPPEPATIYENSAATSLEKSTQDCSVKRN